MRAAKFHGDFSIRDKWREIVLILASLVATATSEIFVEEKRSKKAVLIEDYVAISQLSIIYSTS